MKHNPSLVAAGRAFASGLMLELGRWLLIGFAIISLVQMVMGSFGYGWDATDNRATSTRSGVRLRMDHGTGCQYLETSAGGITPRRDRTGRQVCRP